MFFGARRRRIRRMLTGSLSRSKARKDTEEAYIEARWESCGEVPLLTTNLASEECDDASRDGVHVPIPCGGKPIRTISFLELFGRFEFDFRRCENFFE